MKLIDFFLGNVSGCVKVCSWCAVLISWGFHFISILLVVACTWLITPPAFYLFWENIYTVCVISQRWNPKQQVRLFTLQRPKYWTWFLWIFFCRLQEWQADEQLVNGEEWQEEKMPLHKAPDLGVGEGVSVQYVSDPRAPPRDQQERQPDRQAGQDLVSEPQDETEENEQGKPHPWTDLKSHLFVSSHVSVVSCLLFYSPLTYSVWCFSGIGRFILNFNETVTIYLPILVLFVWRHVLCFVLSQGNTFWS